MKLTRKKHYWLVGFEKYGFNAFFVRNDVGASILSEIELNEYNDIPFVKWAQKEFLSTIKDMPWQEEV